MCKRLGDAFSNAVAQHEMLKETVKQSRDSASGLMMMKYPHIPRDAALAQKARKTGEPVTVH